MKRQNRCRTSLATPDLKSRPTASPPPNQDRRPVQSSSSVTRVTSRRFPTVAGSPATLSPSHPGRPWHGISTLPETSRAVAVSRLRAGAGLPPLPTLPAPGEDTVANESTSTPSYHRVAASRGVQVADRVYAFFAPLGTGILRTASVRRGPQAEVSEASRRSAGVAVANASARVSGRMERGSSSVRRRPKTTSLSELGLGMVRRISRRHALSRSPQPRRTRHGTRRVEHGMHAVRVIADQRQASTNGRSGCHIPPPT